MSSVTLSRLLNLVCKMGGIRSLTELRKIKWNNRSKSTWSIVNIQLMQKLLLLFIIWLFPVSPASTFSWQFHTVYSSYIRWTSWHYQTTFLLGLRPYLFYEVVFFYFMGHNSIVFPGLAKMSTYLTYQNKFHLLLASVADRQPKFCPWLLFPNNPDFA